MRTWKYVCLCLSICAASSVAFAQPVVPAKPPAALQGPVAPQKSVLSQDLTDRLLAGRETPASPEALNRAQSSPDRATLLKALASHPESRAQLATAVGARSLRALDSLLALGAAPGAAPKPMAIPDDDYPRKPSTKYDDFDWKAGVQFSPAYCDWPFREGDSDYHLAAMTAYGACLWPQLTQADQYRQKVVLLSPGDGVVFLDIHLPADPGAYMISLLLVPQDGRSLAEWQQQYPWDALLPAFVEDATGTRPLDLVPLDDTGLVALSSITPGDLASESTLTNLRMKVVNCRIGFQLDPDERKSPLDKLLFGGITITRL